MKTNKVVAWLMALLMMFSTMSALAEEPALPALEEKTLPDGSELTALINKPGQTDRASFGTDDIVEIHEDGSADVTVNGITLSVLPPFGWTLLTQDVLAQLETYMSFTDEVGTLQASLKENNIHVFVFDLLTFASASFVTGEDGYSKLFGNMSEIPEKYYDTVGQALKQAYGADEVSVVTLGENTFFKLLLTQEGNEAIEYVTYVQGQGIAVYCEPGEEGMTDYQMETFDLMVTDLVIRAE